MVRPARNYWYQKHITVPSVVTRIILVMVTDVFLTQRSFPGQFLEGIGWLCRHAKGNIIISIGRRINPNLL